ncbi:MAG: hypothetical protein COW84_01605 [Gammaproteobacteria bacterium CG22_combo_CG10-13_8_21_14_all_40_8]|nr:MAG: hypothetical protein COW84_01605 [Gammaproteobacteria bacterium CG22_combo_CG10-13_8_21_14_all_40_8]
MITVYSAGTAIDAQIVFDHLEAAGFDVMISGSALAGAVGELPANLSPSIQLLNDEDYLQARALVEELEIDLNHVNTDSDWICANCGESLAANFGQCWNCGTER